MSTIQVPTNGHAKRANGNGLNISPSNSPKGSPFNNSFMNGNNDSNQAEDL